MKVIVKTFPDLKELHPQLEALHVFKHMNKVIEVEQRTGYQGRIDWFIKGTNEGLDERDFYEVKRVFNPIFTDIQLQHGGFIPAYMVEFDEMLEHVADDSDEEEE